MTVLIETRFCGARKNAEIWLDQRLRLREIHNSWYPDFTSKVYGETESRFAVKRHWWSKIEWLPKQGTFLRASALREGSGKS